MASTLLGPTYNNECVHLHWTCVCGGLVMSQVTYKGTFTMAAFEASSFSGREWWVLRNPYSIEVPFVYAIDVENQI